jgi:hypothetical protein
LKKKNQLPHLSALRDLGGKQIIANTKRALHLEEMIEMDEIRITRVIKDLMSLLQNIYLSESEEEYLQIQDINGIADSVEVDLEKLKEELGSWYIADCKLYVGS